MVGCVDGCGAIIARIFSSFPVPREAQQHASLAAVQQYFLLLQQYLVFVCDSIEQGTHQAERSSSSSNTSCTGTEYQQNEAAGGRG